MCVLASCYYAAAGDVNTGSFYFSVTGEGGEQSFPFWVMPLYGGGVFDKNYNTGRQPITIPIPDSTKKVKKNPFIYYYF